MRNTSALRQRSAARSARRDRAVRAARRRDVDAVEVIAMDSLHMEELICKRCGNSFFPKRKNGNVDFCSFECKRLARHDEYALNSNIPNRSSSATTGAIHELLVCIDLMRRGYNVFRAQSPSCPCDVIALLNGCIYKVEVTTGQLNFNNNGISYPRKSDRYDYDIMAVVFHNGKILYLKNHDDISAFNIDFYGIAIKKGDKS